jgi:predicted RNA-binding Zn-ribbon protein involved in translation (DUF1610 family)
MDERTLQWRIACPACGGGIAVHDGSRVLHCTFCGERHLRNRAHVMALEVGFGADVDVASADIKRWLREHGHRATSMGDAVRLLVPYWRATGKSLLWATSSDHDDVHSGDVPETQFEFTNEVRPAFDGADAFPVDDELPSGFGFAIPFDSSATPDNVLVAAPGEDLPFAIGDQGDDVSPDGPVMRCELDRELALVYYPFFALRYTFRDEHHTVIACGVTGRIHGLAPGDVRASISGQLGGQAIALRSPSGAPPDPLGCPECGRHLEASEEALHHSCPCGRDWALEDAGVQAVKCHHVRGSGEVLPFWRFDLHLERGDRGVRVERHAFVPAFEPCPPTLLRRLAVGLTELEPEYDTHPGPAVGDSTWPCRLSMGEARRTMGVLTRELWENSVLSDIEDVALVWIPFESKLGYLVDPVTQVRMPDPSFFFDEDERAA